MEILRCYRGGSIYSPIVSIVEGIGVFPARWRAILFICSVVMFRQHHNAFVDICRSELFLQHDPERPNLNHSDVSRSGISPKFPPNSHFLLRLGFKEGSNHTQTYPSWWSSCSLVGVTFARPMTELRTKDPPFFAGIVLLGPFVSQQKLALKNWEYLDGHTDLASS